MKFFPIQKKQQTKTKEKKMKVKNLAFFGIMASILGVSAANAAGNDGTALTTKAYVDKYDAATLQSAQQYTTNALSNFSPANNIADNSLSGEKLQSGTVAEAKLDSTLAAKIDGAVQSADLSTVVPANQTKSDWDETDSSSAAYIENKPNLALVATTGDYNDLSGRPTNTDYVENEINSAHTTMAPSGQAVSSAITTINTALAGKQATIDSTNTLSGAYLTDGTVSSAKLDTALSSTINSKLDANSALNGANLTNGTVTSAKLDTALSSTISGKLNANAAIQSGTHTKITYDTNGLVTGGENLATTDLPVPTVNIDGVGQTCPSGTRCVLTYTNNTWSLTPMNTVADETVSSGTGA
jgi:hypothetical protein